MSPGKIRVLVVDDSVFYRVALPRMLHTAPDIEVVDVAKDGAEALEKIRRLKPDVVTLDIIMPVMDGLTTLKKLMEENPLPVVMLSSLTKRGAEEAIECLSIGAVDFVGKPDGEPKPGSLTAISHELVAKVRAAATSTLHPRRIAPQPTRPLGMVSLGTLTQIGAVIAIVASTGGPDALQNLVPQLPANLPIPVVICQHMAVGFLEALTKSLNDSSQVKVLMPAPRTVLDAGTAYVTSFQQQPVLHRRGGRLVIEGGAGEEAPADMFLESASQACQSRACGVVLTGMGSDGAQGLLAIRKAGGLAIAQDKDSSLLFGMPARAAELGAAELVLPLDAISGAIVRFAEGLLDEVRSSY